MFPSQHSVAHQRHEQIVLSSIHWTYRLRNSNISKNVPNVLVVLAYSSIREQHPNYVSGFPYLALVLFAIKMQIKSFYISFYNYRSSLNFNVLISF